MGLMDVLKLLKPDYHNQLQYASSAAIQHAIAIFGLHFAMWVIGEKLKLLEKYRVQKAPHKPGTQPSMKKVVLVVLINHALYFLFSYAVFQPIMARGVLTKVEDFKLFTAMWQFLMCFLLEDTIFYWAHRMLHHRSIYKYVHKLHHEFRRPSILASEYTHPVEFVAGNLIATMAGILLCAGLKLGGGMHHFTITLWLTYRILETADGHCGFALPMPLFPLIPFIPFHPGVKPHDYHHSHNVGNYGSQLLFWDKFCNTFRGTIENPVRLDRSSPTSPPSVAPEPHKSKGL
jgi:methylsterol monooxygenase/4-alpha-methyl-delta7-sterol-4alpha-methyl oxidase